MNHIKAKRLLRIAEEFKTRYPTVAAELRQLVGGALNPPHARPVTGPIAELIAANLKDAVSEVLTKLKGQSLALAGGYAVIQWIDIRKTHDADFVVLGPTFEKLGEIFPGGEYKDIIYTVKIHGEDVDFLTPELFPWTDKAMQAAVSKSFMGHQVKVLTPEYLVLYKFQAGRDRDFSDIKALLTLPGVPDKASHLVALYMPQELEDFKQILMEAEYGL